MSDLSRLQRFRTMLLGIVIVTSLTFLMFDGCWFVSALQRQVMRSDRDTEYTVGVTPPHDATSKPPVTHPVDIPFGDTTDHDDTTTPLDWPHRRGPNQDGTTTGRRIVDHWPSEGPPVAWLRDDLGQSYSAAIIVGEHLYTQSQSSTTQYIYCLETATGKTVWRHRYAIAYSPHGMYPGPRSTPTYWCGNVYYVGPDGLLGCLDARTGNTIWQLDLEQRFGLHGVGFGYAASPTIVDSTLYLPVGSEGSAVIALDAHTGDLCWQSGDDPASYCSAMPITYNGRRLLASLGENSLVIHDRASGQIVARTVYSKGYNEHSAAPLYDEPLLVVTSPFRAGAECYELIPSRTEFAPNRTEFDLDLKPKWINRDLSCDTASALLIDRHIYGFNLRDPQSKLRRPSRGTFKCLALETGHTCWESELPGHASCIALLENLAADVIAELTNTPEAMCDTTDQAGDDVNTLHAHKLILLNDRGELILAIATPERYEELARAEVFPGEICWTAPALSDGRVYLRSPTRLVCIDLRCKADRPTPAITAYSSGDLRDTGDFGAVERPAVMRTSDIPRRRRLDLNRLVGGERTYPADPASTSELTVWYTAMMLGVFLPVIVLTLLLRLLCNRAFGMQITGITLFRSGLMLGGLVAGPVLNRWCDQFIFTWPLCLAVAHQWALEAVLLSNAKTAKPVTDSMLADFVEPKTSDDISCRDRWSPILATTLFIATCAAYFRSCQALGLANEWLMLVVPLPSWPITLPLAWLTTRPRHRSLAITIVCYGLALSVYFLIGAAITQLRAG